MDRRIGKRKERAREEGRGGKLEQGRRLTKAGPALNIIR